MIALRTVSLDADCHSSTATSLPARSDTDLISGRAIKSATRWSVLSLGTGAVSMRPETSALFASCCCREAAVAIVRCSARAVAAATCSCIVLASDVTAAPPVGSEAATLTRAGSDETAALPSGCSSAIFSGGTRLRRVGPKRRPYSFFGSRRPRSARPAQAAHGDALRARAIRKSGG
jgi:hypothetical protein